MTASAPVPPGSPQVSASPPLVGAEPPKPEVSQAAPPPERTAEQVKEAVNLLGPPAIQDKSASAALPLAHHAISSDGGPSASAALREKTATQPALAHLAKDAISISVQKEPAASAPPGAAPGAAPPAAGGPAPAAAPAPAPAGAPAAAPAAAAAAAAPAAVAKPTPAQIQDIIKASDKNKPQQEQFAIILEKLKAADVDISQVQIKAVLDPQMERYTVEDRSGFKFNCSYSISGPGIDPAVIKEFNSRFGSEPVYTYTHPLSAQKAQKMAEEYALKLVPELAKKAAEPKYGSTLKNVDANVQALRTQTHFYADFEQKKDEKEGTATGRFVGFKSSRDSATLSFPTKSLWIKMDMNGNKVGETETRPVGREQEPGVTYVREEDYDLRFRHVSIKATLNAESAETLQKSVEEEQAQLNAMDSRFSGAENEANAALKNLKSKQAEIDAMKEKAIMLDGEIQQLEKGMALLSIKFDSFDPEQLQTLHDFIVELRRNSVSHKKLDGALNFIIQELKNKTGGDFRIDSFNDIKDELIAAQKRLEDKLKPEMNKLGDKQTERNKLYADSQAEYDRLKANFSKMQQIAASLSQRLTQLNAEAEKLSKDPSKTDPSFAGPKESLRQHIAYLEARQKKLAANVAAFRTNVKERGKEFETLFEAQQPAIGVAGNLPSIVKSPQVQQAPLVSQSPASAAGPAAAAAGAPAAAAAPAQTPQQQFDTAFNQLLTPGRLMGYNVQPDLQLRMNEMAELQRVTKFQETFDAETDKRATEWNADDLVKESYSQLVPRGKISSSEPYKEFSTTMRELARAKRDLLTGENRKLRNNLVACLKDLKGLKEVARNPTTQKEARVQNDLRALFNTVRQLNWNKQLGTNVTVPSKQVYDEKDCEALEKILSQARNTLEQDVQEKQKAVNDAKRELLSSFDPTKKQIDEMRAALASIPEKEKKKYQAKFDAVTARTKKTTDFVDSELAALGPPSSPPSAAAAAKAPQAKPAVSAGPASPPRPVAAASPGSAAPAQAGAPAPSQPPAAAPSKPIAASAAAPEALGKEDVNQEVVDDLLRRWNGAEKSFGDRPLTGYTLIIAQKAVLTSIIDSEHPPKASELFEFMEKAGINERHEAILGNTALDNLIKNKYKPPKKTGLGTPDFLIDQRQKAQSRAPAPARPAAPSQPGPAAPKTAPAPVQAAAPGPGPAAAAAAPAKPAEPPKAAPTPQPAAASAAAQGPAAAARASVSKAGSDLETSFDGIAKQMKDIETVGREVSLFSHFNALSKDELAKKIQEKQKFLSPEFLKFWDLKQKYYQGVNEAQFQDDRLEDIKQVRLQLKQWKNKKVKNPKQDAPFPQFREKYKGVTRFEGDMFTNAVEAFEHYDKQLETLESQAAAKAPPVSSEDFNFARMQYNTALRQRVETLETQMEKLETAFKADQSEQNKKLLSRYKAILKLIPPQYKTKV